MGWGSKHFDANKCKVNLKLSLNRMKIQKSKKSNQIQKAKREIAELLRSGKDEIARVKVEHIVREEMLLEAFEILELFIELLLARIKMMTMQSSVPFDLKESICTIIYAAPRMEVKELLQVRGMLVEKYGKPFGSEAMENRGNCVNAKIVHKLSVVTPDNSVVFHYLGEIAKEYNIDWANPFTVPADDSTLFPAVQQQQQQQQPQPAINPLLSGPDPFQQSYIPQPMQPTQQPMFPSVPNASPPAYQPAPNQPPQNSYGLPQPPASSYGAPPQNQFPSPPTGGAGSGGGAPPEIDDLLQRFQNLKN